MSFHNDKVFLESKIVGYQQLEEEAALLKGKLASLELEKFGLVDKISMLEIKA